MVHAGGLCRRNSDLSGALRGFACSHDAWYSEAEKARRKAGFSHCGGAVTAAVLLFTNSHATYYRFNDWDVSGSTVQDIVKRYGEPDINMYTPGRGGSLWYYIYTDEGPIMPDHLEHFYRIGIDENGRAAEISDTVRKGG